MGGAVQEADTRNEAEAVERVRHALVAAGIDEISFTTKIVPAGETAIRLLARSPATESGLAPHPGALLLVEVPCHSLGAAFPTGCLAVAERFR
ncbi:hypothetical protein LV779_08290 [Streptomyces thinghirensis]|nr:hypothetical protein [Streptomyces thinghirensis]